MSTTPFDELDLAISDMDTPILETQVQTILRELKGIESVRIQERGALVHYHPGTITREQIVDAISQAGFNVTIFQDSASGETHEVSY
jgi:hypothetical protein